MKTKLQAGFFCVLILIALILLSHFHNKNRLEQTIETYSQETETEVVESSMEVFDTDNTHNPKLEFKKRYIFTNDIEKTSFEDIIVTKHENSEWSATLIRFEKLENLKVLTENALNEFTDRIPLPCDVTELSMIGTKNLPTEEGIYRAVLEITDEYGNSTLEEICLVYDTTGACIEDTPDKTLYVETSNLNQEPNINKHDYSITDNVDGKIGAENIQYELELHDADKHEWLVHVFYTDRAGNKSNADFLINVKEKSASNANNNEEVVDADTETTDSTTDTLAIVNELNPSEQKLVDAGIGTVIQLDDETYAILSDADGTIHGQDGGLYLIDYLATLGLEGTVSGSWLPNADYYCYTANQVHEKLNPDDEAWD